MQDVVMEIRKKRQDNPQLDMVKLDHTAAGTVWGMPNDKGGVTIMKPSDY
jgi:hypothetical protein